MAVRYVFMRTFAGISVVVVLEVAVAVAVVLWRRRSSDARAFARAVAPGSALTAVLEIEDCDALLASSSRLRPVLPVRILDELRADPLLGLADVQVVQHVQPTGVGLPERSQVGLSYQDLNESVARAARPALGGADSEPVPALRLTWLALRLELPGSRNAEWADRGSEPIAARGGGAAGAARTIDKAVRTAAAKLAVAGFTARTLTENDLQQSLATSYGVPATEDVLAGGGGVVVGMDPSRRPVVLGLFGRGSPAVSLIGGFHLAQLLVLRAAGVGARVIVETARPESWDALVLRSGLDASRLAVQPIGRLVGNPGWPSPSPTAPLLVLRDCGARPRFATAPHGPWATVLTLLPYLDPRTAGQVGAADLVGVQRMPAAEAPFAAVALRLSARDAAALLELPDAMTLWRARGSGGHSGTGAGAVRRYAETVPTAWERGILGDPSR